MNAPSVDVKDILESAGVGTFGTDLFVDQEPEVPNAVVTVRDTGGFEPEANFIYLRPTVQVRVRGAVGAFTSAYTKIESVRNALHGLVNETWNSTRYIGIWSMGDVISLGRDELNRPMLACNFRIHRTNI